MEQPPNSGKPHGDNISNNANGDSENNQGTTVPHITQHEEEDSTHSSTASVNNSNNSPQRQAVLFAPPGNQVIFFDPSNNFQAHAGPDVNQPQALQLEGDEADTNQEEPHVGEPKASTSILGKELGGGDGDDSGDSGDEGGGSDSDESNSLHSSGNDEPSQDSDLEAIGETPEKDNNDSKPSRKSTRVRTVSKKASEYNPNVTKGTVPKKRRKSSQHSNTNNKLNNKLGSGDQSYQDRPEYSPLASSRRRGKEREGINRAQGANARPNTTSTYINPKNQILSSFKATSQGGKRVGGKKKHKSTSAVRESRLINLEMSTKETAKINSGSGTNPPDPVGPTTGSNVVNNHHQEKEDEQQEKEVEPSKEPILKTIVQGGSLQAGGHPAVASRVASSASKTWTKALSIDQARAFVDNSGMDSDSIQGYFDEPSPSIDEVANELVGFLKVACGVAKVKLPPYNISQFKKLFTNQDDTVKWFADMFNRVRETPPHRVLVPNPRGQAQGVRQLSTVPPILTSETPLHGTFRPQWSNNFPYTPNHYNNDHLGDQTHFGAPNNVQGFQYGGQHVGHPQGNNNMHGGNNSLHRPTHTVDTTIGDLKSPPEGFANTPAPPAPAKKTSTGSKKPATTRAQQKTSQKEKKKARHGYSNRWLQDSSQLGQAKFSYESMVTRTRINKYSHQGTHYYHRKNETWYVVHTDHGEAELDEEHNRIGPKEYVGPTRGRGKRASAGGTRQARPGFRRWKTSSENHINHVPNYYPSDPKEPFPNFLTNWPGALLPPPASLLPPLTRVCGVHCWSPLYGKNCERPGHNAGCGLNLEVGETVVIDGRDTVRADGMTYCVGVFRVGQDLKRTCKVGHVQILAQHLNEITNQYAQVTYVCPHDEQSESNSKTFRHIVRGYFHLALMNAQTDELPSKERVNRHKSKAACTAEVEQDCPHNEYRQFDPDLPTEDEFNKNKDTNKNSREKRQGRTDSRQSTAEEYNGEEEETEQGHNGEIH